MPLIDAFTRHLLARTSARNARNSCSADYFSSTSLLRVLTGHMDLLCHSHLNAHFAALQLSNFVACHLKKNYRNLSQANSMIGRERQVGGDVTVFALSNHSCSGGGGRCVQCMFFVSRGKGCF